MGPTPWRPSTEPFGRKSLLHPLLLLFPYPTHAHVLCAATRAAPKACGEAIILPRPSVSLAGLACTWLACACQPSCYALASLARAWANTLHCHTSWIPCACTCSKKFPVLFPGNGKHAFKEACTN